MPVRNESMGIDDFQMVALDNDSDTTHSNAHEIFNEPTEKKDSEIVMAYEFRVGTKMLFTLDEHQYYRKSYKLKTGEISYLCNVKRCGVRIYLKPDGVCYMRRSNSMHTHNTDQLTAEQIKLKANIKRRVAEARSKNETADFLCIFEEESAK